MDDIKNIFYLIGFQRSCTTILSHLLDKHPEIVCLNEPELSKRIVYKQLRILSDPSYQSIQRSFEFYSVNPDQYVDIAKKYTDNEIDEAELLSSAYWLFGDNETRVAGAKEVLEPNAEMHNWLENLLYFHKRGNVKYIFLERDIKSVVASFIKLGFFPPSKKKVNNWNMKSFARSYIQILNKAYLLLSQRNTLFLNLENITIEPEKNMINIFSFLDVDTSDELIGNILFSESNGNEITYSGSFNEPTKCEDYLSEKQILWLDNYYYRKKIDVN